MNILFINSIGADKFGGGEKWMVSAAKSLSQKGHDVTLASRKNSRILTYAREKDIRTTVIEIHADISPLGTIKLLSYLKKNKIDILVCNLNKDVRVAGLAARIAGNIVVLARHGMLLCGKKWKHKFTLTKLTDGIITNSDTIRQAYASYGWFPADFVKVIYNGIAIPDKVTSCNFAERFPGKKIIFSAGRLSEQKGFPYLIEAAAILAEKRRDLVFVIAGEGRLENELKNLVKSAGLEESFVFEGFIADIFPYLKGCDLFVLASLFEGMPNVVMEAMAMKKPVVATDVNGARELMSDGKTGLIVPPKNPAALAAAITEIIDNAEMLAEFGNAGYERVKQKFTIKAMADNLDEYLHQKVNEKRGAIKKRCEGL